MNAKKRIEEMFAEGRKNALLNYNRMLGVYDAQEEYINSLPEECLPYIKSIGYSIYVSEDIPTETLKKMNLIFKYIIDPQRDNYTETYTIKSKDDDLTIFIRRMGDPREALDGSSCKVVERKYTSLDIVCNRK